MLCNNFEVHYFRFSHHWTPKFRHLRKFAETNVNKQRLFLALGKDFPAVFCWRQRSHRCFTGQTVWRFCWLPVWTVPSL